MLGHGSVALRAGRRQGDDHPGGEIRLPQAGGTREGDYHFCDVVKRRVGRGGKAPLPCPQNRPISQTTGSLMVNPLAAPHTPTICAVGLEEAGPATDREVRKPRAAWG